MKLLCTANAKVIGVRGHVCTSGHREVPWDSRGEEWEVALYPVLSSDLLYMCGAHIPYFTQQKRIPSPCWKHTSPGQAEASTLQIQGCPLRTLDSLSPARYLIYTVEYLLWTILHFPPFYYWQCKCKCQWSPLWFPPNLKNRNEGQLLRILEFQRDLITAGRDVPIGEPGTGPGVLLQAEQKQWGRGCALSTGT